MIKGVIFDMDGVIIDSEPINYQAFMNYTRTSLELTISDEEYNTFIGSSNKQMYSTLKQKYGIKQQVNVLVEEYEKKMIEFLLLSSDKIVPIDGVDLLIKNIYHDDIKLALASSAAKNRICTILSLLNFTQYFHSSVSAQDVHNSKPAPDIFLKAAAALELAPSECLVFEDSKNGTIAAKAAGMKCIAYHNPNSGKQDLSMADWVIESFSEINSDCNFLKKF